MSRRRTLRQCQSGSAAAEMALVLPFLILLLFGGAEVSYYFYNQHQVVKGVRDGARYAARQSFVGLNCNGGTPSTIPSDIATAVKQITRTGQISGGTPRVVGWTDGNITVTVTCPAAAITTGIYRNEANAPQVNVATIVPYRSLFDGLGVIDSSFTLRASQQAAVMGI